MDDEARTYARAERVVSRRVAGEIVLVPVQQRTDDPVRRTTDLFVLNASGEFLWELLETPRSASDLARKLIAEYGLTSEEAATDVSAFLTSLSEIGAVTELENI